ncbi:unnamed protein product [Effrenium voratum]|nr:unnamed protein product [Effrenium voratum]
MPFTKNTDAAKDPELRAKLESSLAQLGKLLEQWGETMTLLDCDLLPKLYVMSVATAQYKNFGLEDVKEGGEAIRAYFSKGSSTAEFSRGAYPKASASLPIKAFGSQLRALASPRAELVVWELVLVVCRVLRDPNFPFAVFMPDFPQPLEQTSQLYRRIFGLRTKGGAELGRCPLRRPAKGGLILGPLGLVCVAALSHHCMGLLLKLATRTSTRSFGALASNILGRRAKILVDCCLILTQYGFAIADVENVRDVVCVETAQAACPSRAAVCAGTLICVLPVTWLRSLQVLTVPVLMSNVVLLCGISWVYYCCFVQLGLHGISPNVILFNWAEFPVFFGCAVFSFEGVGLILPIQFAMQQPTQFPKILRRAMFILGSLFASFGMFGYAAYGLDTKDMITFNIPQNKITSFLRLFYCLGIFFTYPVMLFPLYQITEAKIRCLRDQRFCWRRIIFRTTLVIMTGVIGLQIPHFGLFLGIIGSLACSALAFVLPALLHFKRLDRNDASRGGDLKDLSIITFGIYTANWASSFLELLPGEAFACDALFLAIGGLVSFSVTLRDLIHAMVGE